MASGKYGGITGALALPILGITTHALRQNGIKTKNDLERMAMLRPSVARDLTVQARPNETVGPLARGHLQAAVQAMFGANTINNVHRYCLARARLLHGER